MGCGVALTYLENRHQIYLESAQLEELPKSSRNGGKVVKVRNSDSKIVELIKMKNETKRQMETQPAQIQHQIPVTFDNILKVETKQGKEKTDCRSVLVETKTKTGQTTPGNKPKVENSKTPKTIKIPQAKVNQKKQHKLENQVEINSSSIKVPTKESMKKQLQQKKTNEQKTVQQPPKKPQEKKQAKNQKRIIAKAISLEEASDSEVDQTEDRKELKDKQKNIIPTKLVGKQMKNESAISKLKDPKSKQNLNLNVLQTKTTKSKIQAQPKKQKKPGISMQKRIQQEKAALQKEQKKIEQMKKKFYEEQTKKIKKQANQLKQIYIL